MIDNLAPIDILLLEDNPQDLELALRVLGKVSPINQIKVVRDGAEAVEFLFGSAGTGPEPAVPTLKVIILDLKVPKIDGLEVLKLLKSDARTKAIPVVVLTSSQEPRDILESFQLGVNSYVVKPVDFEHFSHAVQQIGQYWLRLNQSHKIVE